MVNFSQDLPYSRLLSVPDENDDGYSHEREFLTLEELKPHHLEHHLELGPQQQLNDSFQHQNLQLVPDQEYNVYYDLNQQTNVPCLYKTYVEGSTIINTPEMTAGTSFISSNSSMDTTNAVTVESHPKVSRKRKFSYSEVSDCDDDDAKSVRTTDESKKANHSEIEKRRRDKMNNFITELSAMIPMCHAMSRKLDKLTVLRMAVQHLKTIRGAVHSYAEPFKPSFLSDQELKMLILQAAEGFLFVVGCDRGRLLYVSESVTEVLNYSQGELLGQSLFDILHPKDVAKIKEQLSSSDLSPRERLIDAKTMLPVKHSDVPQATRLCPGARRSFFCRMKCKNSVQVKEEHDSSGSNVNCRRSKKQFDKKFCVVQCTGYLKSWAPAKIGVEEQEAEAEGDCNLSLSCLVAVGRLVDFNNGYFRPNSKNLNVNTNTPSTSNQSTSTKSDPVRTLQFTSRHAMDGKFLFIDQRATLVLGFLPQELLGTSMYEYFNHKDISALAESHKVALQSTEPIMTRVYGLRTKHSGFIPVQSEWKAFKNPWTKDVEFLIAKNNVILTDTRSYENTGQSRGDEANNYDFFHQSNEMNRMINTHIEASKIGRQIADQVLDYQRRMGDVSSESSPDPDPTLGVSMVSESLLNASLNIDHIDHSAGNSSSAPSTSQRINGTYANFTTYNHARSSTVVSPENLGSSESSEQAGVGVPTDGNDEAAMAVIMSLLEADAGLGGPVDFSNLPWPLP